MHAVKHTFFAKSLLSLLKIINFWLKRMSEIYKKAYS